MTLATGGGLPAAVFGAGVAVVASNVEHSETEDREPTPEEYDLMSDVMRVFLQEVYGQDAYKTSVNEAARKETSERIKKNGISPL